MSNFIVREGNVEKEEKQIILLYEAYILKASTDQYCSILSIESGW